MTQKWGHRRHICVRAPLLTHACMFVVSTGPLLRQHCKWLTHWAKELPCLKCGRWSRPDAMHTSMMALSTAQFSLFSTSFNCKASYNWNQVKQLVTSPWGTLIFQSRMLQRKKISGMDSSNLNLLLSSQHVSMHLSSALQNADIKTIAIKYFRPTTVKIFSYPAGQPRSLTHTSQD